MTIIHKEDFISSLSDALQYIACYHPPDFIRAMHEAWQREASPAARDAIAQILVNSRMCAEGRRPICQDTGTPIFEIHHPLGISTRRLAEQIRRAVAIATERSYLRPNAVDSLTGKNSGDNSGEDFPTMHFHEWDEPSIHVDVLLKGGGCENVSTQYKLPDGGLKAGRDLEGVRRVVLDSVMQAQGKGCGPGILGVCVGGDRGSGGSLPLPAFVALASRRHS